MIAQIDSGQTLTQFQLKSRINKQTIPVSQPNNPSCTLYYTLCLKRAVTISVLTNSRLLIFKQPSNTLFYINYDSSLKCPFAAAPKVKNNEVHITQAVIKKDWEEKAGNVLIVLFTKNKPSDKSKKEVQTFQWSFQMPVKLVQVWERLIIDKKQKALIQTVVGNALGIPDMLGSIQKIQSPKQIKPSNSPVLVSKIDSPKKSKEVENLNIKTDWNLEFLNSPNMQTTRKFQEYAQQQFMLQSPQGIKFKIPTISNQNAQSNNYPQKSAYTDRHSPLPSHRTNNIKISILSNLILFIAESSSPQAVYLNQQFDNYHYILRCCRDKQFCIGVPLVCLIHYKGLVCLAKSPLPNQNSILSKQCLQSDLLQTKRVLGLFKQLEQHTKIRADVIINNSIIVDVSSSYPFPSGQNQPRIYIDELRLLLPHYPKISTFAPFSSQTSDIPTPLVNHCLISHNFGNVVHPQDNQTSKEVTYFTDQAAKQLAEYLIVGRVIVGGIKDLKQIIEIFRLKSQFLPLVLYYINMRTKSQQCRYIKKLFANALLCDLIIARQIKPILKQSCNIVFDQSKVGGSLQSRIESIITNYCGSTAQSSLARNTEKWKQIQKVFKKQYGFGLNRDHIQSGVLLHGLIDSIKGSNVDISSFHANQQKLRIQFKPLTVGYDEVSSQIQQKIVPLLAETKINKVQQILSTGIFEQSNIDYHLSEQNQSKLLIYLSFYISPLGSINSTQKKIVSIIYQTVEQLSIGQSPFNFESYNITKNYLMHCSRYLAKSQQPKQKERYRIKFMNVVEQLKLRVKQWYGKQHPYLAEILYLESYFMGDCEQDGSMALVCLNKAVQLWENQVGKLKGESLIKYYAAIGQLGLDWGDTKTARKGFESAKDVLQSMQHHSTLNNNELHVEALISLARVQLSQLNYRISLKHIATCHKLIEKNYKYTSILKNPLALHSGTQMINISKLYQQNSGLYKLYVDSLCLRFRVHEIERDVQGMSEDVGELGKIIHLMCEVNKNKNIDQRLSTCMDICVSGILYKVWHEPAGIQKLQILNKLIKTSTRTIQDQHNDPILQLMNMIPSNLTLPEHFSHLINKLPINASITSMSHSQLNDQTVRFVHLLDCIMDGSMQDKISNVYELFESSVP